MAGIFRNKVAIVTGGGSGIGRASAIAFANEGVKVGVVDINIKNGEETVHLIEEKGGTATFIRCDVSQSGEVDSMVNQVTSIYGRLDIAHNNAGIEPQMVPLTESTEEDWDKVISINLKGVWLCMKYEIPHMIKGGGGAIVNTASVVSFLGQKNMASYVAGKHGVLGLTRAAALESIEDGIHVNAVCPAIVATPMLDRFTQGYKEVAAGLTADYPLKRLIEPEEVAQAVVWLCSEKASYLNGHHLVIDGGMSIQ